jgi:hypothetical protein
MDNDNLEKKIKVFGAKNGVLLGLILLSLSIFSFYFITSIARSLPLLLLGPIIFTFVIPVIIVVLLCFNFRKKIGGFWTVRQATTGIFIMFLTAYVIQIVGRDLVFAKFIEPDMAKKTQAAFINTSTSLRSQPGANQKQIDQNIADIKKGFEEQSNITIAKFIQGLAISIIFIFVFALIFAGLFKKEPILYNNEIDAVS